jgi:hypothetical protein
MKKIRGHEPIGVIIHIYMEIPQGNSLYNYLYLQQSKISTFFSFPSTKSENRKAEQFLSREGVGTSGRGELLGKECRTVNIV